MSGTHLRARLNAGLIPETGSSSSVNPAGFFAGGRQPRSGNVAELERWSQGGPIGGIDGTAREGLMRGIYRAGENESLMDPKNMALSVGMNVTGAAEHITSQHMGQFADTEFMSRGGDPRRWHFMFAARVPKPVSQSPSVLMFCMLGKVNRELENSWANFLNKLHLYAAGADDAQPHPDSLMAQINLGKRSRADYATMQAALQSNANIRPGGVHALNMNTDATYNVRFMEEFSAKYAYLGISNVGGKADEPESLQHSIPQLLQIINQGRVTHLRDIFGPLCRGDYLYLALIRPNTGSDISGVDITQLPPLKIVPVVMRDGAGIIYNSSWEPLMDIREAMEMSNQDRADLAADGLPDHLLSQHRQHVGIAVNAAYNGRYALQSGARCFPAYDPKEVDVYSPDLSFIDVRMITPNHTAGQDPQNGSLIRQGDARSASGRSAAKFRGDSPLIAVQLATALRYYVGFVENTEVGEPGTTDINRSNALMNSYEMNLMRGMVGVFAEM